MYERDVTCSWPPCHKLSHLLGPLPPRAWHTLWRAPFQTRLTPLVEEYESSPHPSWASIHLNQWCIFPYFLKKLISPYFRKNTFLLNLRFFPLLNITMMHYRYWTPLPSVSTSTQLLEGITVWCRAMFLQLRRCLPCFAKDPIPSLLGLARRVGLRKQTR